MDIVRCYSIGKSERDSAAFMVLLDDQEDAAPLCGGCVYVLVVLPDQKAAAPICLKISVSAYYIPGTDRVTLVLHVCVLSGAARTTQLLTFSYFSRQSSLFLNLSTTRRCALESLYPMQGGRMRSTTQLRRARVECCLYTCIQTGYSLV